MQNPAIRTEDGACEPGGISPLWLPAVYTFSPPYLQAHLLRTGDPHLLLTLYRIEPAGIPDPQRKQSKFTVREEALHVPLRPSPLSLGLSSPPTPSAHLGFCP